MTRPRKNTNTRRVGQMYTFPRSLHRVLENEGYHKNTNRSRRAEELILLGRAAEKAGWRPQAQEAG